MKILCVIQCANLGGMEKVTLDSLALLQAGGHEVRLFSLHPVGDLKPLADKKGIALSGARSYRLYGLGSLGGMLRTIRQFKPDRLWLVGHNFAVLALARLVRCPVYQSIHYHHSERSPRLWKLFYSLAGHTCSRIHFVSRYIFEEVADCIAEESVVCFPNMVPPPETAPSRAVARQLIGLPADAFVVGNAGWLIPRKAVDVFLQVAARVRRSIPDALFVIAGDGAERQRLEQLAVELELENAVCFPGWQKDLEPLYASLDVLLFNSHFDCLPTTPLEAMVRGVPVVCSLAAGGLKEILRHGRDGFLMDRHDISALADEIVRLHADAQGRAEMAEAGRRRVQEMCSSETHLKNLNRFLEL